MLFDAIYLHSTSLSISIFQMERAGSSIFCNSHLQTSRYYELNVEIYVKYIMNQIVKKIISNNVRRARAGRLTERIKFAVLIPFVSGYDNRHPM